MEIRTTYKFEYEKEGKTLRGVSAGFLPNYSTKVLETFNILYPDKGKYLKRLSDETVAGYFVIEDGDSQDNYEEIEKQDRLNQREVENADSN